MELAVPWRDMIDYTQRDLGRFKFHITDSSLEKKEGKKEGKKRKFIGEKEDLKPLMTKFVLRAHDSCNSVHHKMRVWAQVIE